MTLHPIFAAQIAAPLPPLTHRGWTLALEETSLNRRDFDWTARHADFDGPEGDDRIVHGPSREAVIARVDAWLAEEVDL
jgi:hypothetical protein